MLDKFAEKMNPKTAQTVKVAAIVVAALAGAVVTGVVLYKMGLIGTDQAVLEEIVTTAAEAA